MRFPAANWRRPDHTRYASAVRAAPRRSASVTAVGSWTDGRSFSGLLRERPADFTAGVGRGVDVEIDLAGVQIGDLGVGQRGRALDRARADVAGRHDRRAVAARRGGVVEVGSDRRTGQVLEFTV